MAELSGCYRVSEQSIYKLLAKYRATGSVAVQTYEPLPGKADTKSHQKRNESQKCMDLRSDNLRKTFCKNIGRSPADGGVGTQGVIKALDAGKDGVLRSGAGIKATQDG